MYRWPGSLNPINRVSLGQSVMSAGNSPRYVSLSREGSMNFFKRKFSFQEDEGDAPFEDPSQPSSTSPFSFTAIANKVSSTIRSVYILPNLNCSALQRHQLERANRWRRLWSAVFKIAVERRLHFHPMPRFSSLSTVFWSIGASTFGTRMMPQSVWNR